MNNHEFDDIIKQKAQQREADVPADIWNSISTEKEKRKRPFIWFLFLMLCIGGIGFFINIKIRESRVTDLAAEKVNAGKTSESTTPKLEKETSVNKITSTTSPSKREKDELQTSQNIIPAEIKLPVATKNQTGDGLVKSKQRVEFIDKPASLNSKNSKADNNSASKKSKEVNNETIDATTAKGETNIFTSVRKTKNSKGASKVNILAAEMEADQQVTNQNNSTRDNVLVKEQSYHDDVMSDSATLKQSQRETVVIPEIKSSVQGTGDSAAITKIIVSLKDSTLKKTDEQIAQKVKVNNKKSGLKIEAGIAVVSPLQHYAQPLYIKRTLTTANVYADFKTDHFQSTIEQGIGFNIHLVKSFNKRTEAGAGIAYLRFTEKIQMKGIESKTNYTLVQRLVTGPTGSFLKEDTVSIVSKDSVTLNGRNVYNQLTMPVFIRYRIVNRNKWSCSITGGVNIDLIRMYHNDLPGKFETIYTSSTVSAAAKNSIGLGLSAGLHFSGLLYKKYQWLAATSFNYNLTPYTTNLLSSNKRIHLPGILFGVSYQLKK